jgi:predicted nucleotidyltransferase component of viral defense system
MTEEPVISRKVKIEINTREHYHVRPHINVPFGVNNPWYIGRSAVLTHPIEEILATKLRALYQRKKGRDLYDFWYVAQHISELDHSQVIDVFQHYMDHGNTPVSRAQFEKNLIEKQKNPVFNGDITPLLSLRQNQSYSTEQAYAILFKQYLPKLKGEPWKNLSDE